MERSPFRFEDGLPSGPEPAAYMWLLGASVVLCGLALLVFAAALLSMAVASVLDVPRDAPTALLGALVLLLSGGAALWGLWARADSARRAFGHHALEQASLRLASHIAMAWLKADGPPAREPTVWTVVWGVAADRRALRPTRVMAHDTQGILLRVWHPPFEDHHTLAWPGRGALPRGFGTPTLRARFPRLTAHQQVAMAAAVHL